MKSILLTSSVILFSFNLFSQISDEFERNVGENTFYGGYSDLNFHFGELYGLPIHSGESAFMSANGTDGEADSIGFKKDLGGNIEDTVYDVAIYIAKYADLDFIGIENIYDFRIGGEEGTIIWDSMPEPTEDAIWYRWSGKYTPSASDIGENFSFYGLWKITAYTSIALDGLVTVSENSDVQSNISSSTNEPVLSIYPNPITDHLYISFYLNEPGDAQISIVDCNGRQVYLTEMHTLPIGMNELKLDLSDQFTKGIYLLRIQTVETISTQTILIQ